MKTRKSSNRLLMAIVIVCCCQQISAGLGAKASKAKNSTTTTKELTATTKHPKVMHKIKVTTTTTTTPSSTTSTTEKPELEITTLPITDMDLDGRSAFINNQYVSDAELTVHDTSSPLYELLQRQMETVLTDKGGKLELYSLTSPQMKESLDELTQKPLFGYDVAQFDDYDEEEDTSEEYTPDNCEDTQESLKDNDSSNNQQNLLNNYGQSLGDSTQVNLLQQTKPNKPYDSSNYGPQTAQVTSSIYNTGQNAYIHKKPNNKATQKPQATKTKPSPSHQQSSNQNAYGQPKPSEQYTQKDEETKDQNSNKQQQSTNQKPQQISYNTPKPSSTKPQTQHSKPKPAYNTLNQKLQTSTFQNLAAHNNQNFTNLQPTNPYVSRLPSLITSAPVNPTLGSNFLYGSAGNTPSLSPFSSTSTSTTSATAQQKRHLTFRTVASSTQYVSSPLADLMFKFSIGMAKPANSNSVSNFGDNPAQIYNLINDQ